MVEQTPVAVVPSNSSQRALARSICPRRNPRKALRAAASLASPVCVCGHRELRPSRGCGLAGASGESRSSCASADRAGWRSSPTRTTPADATQSSMIRRSYRGRSGGVGIGLLRSGACNDPTALRVGVVSDSGGADGVAVIATVATTGAASRRTHTSIPMLRSGAALPIRQSDRGDAHAPHSTEQTASPRTRSEFTARTSASFTRSGIPGIVTALSRAAGDEVSHRRRPDHRDGRSASARSAARRRCRSPMPPRESSSPSVAKLSDITAWSRSALDGGDRTVLDPRPRGRARIRRPAVRADRAISRRR